jgi:hypothetical protein
MFANVLGGIIAGLIAVSILIIFTHTDADRAPLFRRGHKEPRAVKPPEPSGKDRSQHREFHRPSRPVSPVGQEVRTA